MKSLKTYLLLVTAVLLSTGHFALAQDSVKVEPIDPTIDVAKLTYDILVDGNLPQDDPANNKYKTLQAAYAAAPEGTEEKPTVIGIKPNVYQLPGEATGTSLSMTKNYITLLGLTNNRRAVVLADNRGHMEGGQGNGYILDVNANGFTLKNLTVLNYCNTDYEYPGDPSKNLKMRNPVITQAVAIQTAGDKHVYENVAFLSRLDTTFLRTTRSYLKNVYIEGPDDFIGGGTISVWENCEIVFPTGRGVMSASGITFINCKFEATHGLQFSKSEFGSGGGRFNALINCVMPVNSPQGPVAWVRGVPAPRPSQFSLTYHTKDTSGKPAVIYDSSVGPPTFTYSRELSDQEALAFNPWNLLRAVPNGAVDDWDPAGVKAKYEAAGQGSLIYRISLASGQNRGGGGRGGAGGGGGFAGPSVSSSIRSGGQGATFTATVVPNIAPDQTIKWSTDSNLVSLSQTTGPSVTVTGQNQSGEPQWVPIRATAANGYYITAYVYCEPKYIDPPTFTTKPKINPPANGMASVSYALDLGGRQDQSVITWYICDDLKGTNGREVATSRGNQPMMSLPLTSGYVGKYLLVGVEPKHQISDPGEAVTAITPTPITAADVLSPNITVNFRNFDPTTYETYVNGLWTVLGTWTSEPGDNFANGFGVRAASRGAALLYQQDAPMGDMQVDLVMNPEKSEGMGFGSPGSSVDGDQNQKADVYIKYDPRTKNGYALRWWRTTEYTGKCVYQLFKIQDGVGSPLNDKQVVSGVFKANTHMTLKIVGNTFSATASNGVDDETLSLEGTVTPNRYGGAGVYWSGSIPRGNSNVYSQFAISYPGATAK